MFVTEKGSVFAVTHDGDIVSVCTNKGNGKESSARLFLEYAVKHGGTKLDSFDGNYGFYRHCGFEPISWCKFDESEAPSNWDKNRDKEEPVIFFKYTGKESKYKDVDAFYNAVAASENYGKAEENRENNNILYIGLSSDKSEGQNMTEETNYYLYYDEFREKLPEMQDKFPMTFEEFRTKVYDIFLTKYATEEDIEERRQFLKDAENGEGEFSYDDENYIWRSYASQCFNYWKNKKEGKPIYKRMFEDYMIDSQVTRVLDMIY